MISGVAGWFFIGGIVQGRSRSKSSDTLGRSSDTRAPTLTPSPTERKRERAWERAESA